MLFKLSYKNIKKSMQDYMVYFATLILGVAIFYVFNALDSQTVMMNVSSSTYEIIDLMNNTLSAVSVFVSIILGFLIVYASNFLMKRRKKEFGVYMLLGMSKRKIATIIFGETILIGAISLVVGLAVGIVASQGMSILVANMFEADMTKFTFVLSKSAVTKTIIYFVIMYIVVILLDTVVVGRAKLVNLINASKKAEKNSAKNPIVCIVVFIVAVVLLASAYYNVTTNISNLISGTDILIQIVKGVVGTVLVFWSFSGLLLFLIQKNKRFYMKGLNCFSTRELSSRINTTVLSGSVICLMLFLTIVILASSMAVRKAINDNLEYMVPMDLNLDNDISVGSIGIPEILEQAKVDTNMFKDVIEIVSYKSDTLTLMDTIGEENFNEISTNDDVDEYTKEWFLNPEEILKLSDYNKVAKAYGIEQYSLEDDEYMTVADYEQMIDYRDLGLESKTIITIGGKEYNPKYDKCKDGYISMASNHINFGLIIVPDSADLSKFDNYCSYFMANYNPDYSMELINKNSDEKYDSIADYIDSKEFENTMNPKGEKWSYVYVDSQTSIKARSISLTAMIVFVGTYLGIIFMISSAAILALKELSEAADNREKYQILRRIGVDEKMINRSLFTQCSVFFGMPLLLAGIHSIFGMQTSIYILETFGTSGIAYSIAVTVGMLAAIYGVYFVLTYISSKKIIKE